MTVAASKMRTLMVSANANDRWLTPPELIEALGPFDTDPCCEPVMPWRTAAKMIALPNSGETIGPLMEQAAVLIDGGIPADVLGDGLSQPWDGAVFMNPPYSCMGPWCERFLVHADGIALTSAKSPDARWGQNMLARAGLLYLLAGRILFHEPGGARSAGKWLPNALWAIGPEAERRLRAFAARASRGELPWNGHLMRREEP